LLVMRLKIGVGDIEKIREIGRVIRRGGVIVYPTDTLYGIGGDPNNRSAVRRILEIKSRDYGKMPVLVSSIERAASLAIVSEAALFLMGKFWPGALTLVLPKAPGVPEEVSGGGTLGIRMPNHSIALAIIDESGGALIGTSANIHGSKPATSLDELDPSIEGKVDFVVDGGRVPIGRPSTVVQIIEEQTGPERAKAKPKVRVIREGAISGEVIISALEEWRGIK